MRQARLSLRASLAVVLVVVFSQFSGTALAEVTHPAAKYMQKAAQSLMAAQRRGTISAFASAIQRHADVPSIAMYSLGTYRSELRKSKRSAYYRGVRTFMARYFTDQSRKYRVVDAEIDPDVRKTAKDFLVKTRVRLASGSKYNVIWRLKKRRSTYRIVDVKVLGFSLTYLQRGIFYAFLRKRDGDVNALVAALNRK